ncbi:GerAB/ArcD/ProY family transporter [Paenibacillus guangzhouensis]|uniref:GerAB/ArcD/ProY family transporter n=1 Tax=Paenibacillus guangzhouensis TaxID=1473112 RepID=UPI001266D944|nr:endospore germination permease [Paenibacillus guangzhouensis]
MQQDTQISAKQFMILVMLFTIGSAILFIPSGQADYAKQNAWISSIIGVIGGLCFIPLYIVVGNFFPHMNLMQLNEELLGKWVGKAVSLVFLFFFFMAGPASVLYFVGNFMTTQVMPDTPDTSINILFTIVVIIGVYLGLETIARSAEVLIPWFALLFIVMVIFISPQIKWDAVKPILGNGIHPLLLPALSLISVCALPSVILLMIFPSCIRNPIQARKAFYTGYLLGGCVITIIVVLCIFVLGPGVTSRNMYPSYTLVKQINVGDFLERIEAVMAIMWFISLYFRLALYCYAIVIGIAQVFNLKEHRSLILPIGLLLALYSLVVYPTTDYEIRWDTRTWIPYAITIGIFYPLLLLGMAVVRKVGR